MRTKDARAQQPAHLLTRRNTPKIYAKWRRKFPVLARAKTSRASLRGQNDAPAALCGVAGARDVVVRFNLPEKTMSRGLDHPNINLQDRLEKKFRESRASVKVL